MNGQLLNYSAISRQVGAEVPTVQKYFEILEDTLLGFRIEAYHRSIRKRQLQAAKFYFIDPGLRRAFERTLHIRLEARTSEYGWSFEHFIILELYKRNSYARADFEFFHLRTKDDAEIDLVLERAGEPPILIEIKSTERVQETDFKSLLWFKKDFPKSKLFLLSQDTKEQVYEGILGLHWSQIFSHIGI
jgi:predicted AAA+ superfamily ATPase